MPIFDQSYQKFSGKISESPFFRWLPITRNGVVAYIKTRRMLFIFLFSLLFAFWGAAKILITVFIPFIPMDIIKIDETIFVDFFNHQFFWIGIVCLFIGTRIIALDLRSNAHIFYLCRPLTVVDYFTGKFMVIFSYLSVITVIPAGMMLLLKIIFKDKEHDPANIKYFFGIIIVWLLLCIPAALISIACSSLSKNLNVCGFAFLGIYLFSKPVSEILSQIPAAMGKMPLDGNFLSYKAITNILIEYAFYLKITPDTQYAFSVAFMLSLISVLFFFRKIGNSGVNT